MDLGSIFLILALLLLTAWFVGRPLFERQVAQALPERSAEDQANHERSALLAERDRILNALQDLDFDFTLGKIPQEDYPPQRQRLLLRGAEILRQLDALAPAAAAGMEGESAPEGAGMEERLEAAIAARRADAAVAPALVAGGNGNGRKRSIGAAAPDDELEAALAARRRQRGEKAAGFCHRCGKPLQKSDKFCPKCGAKIV